MMLNPSRPPRTFRLSIVPLIVRDRPVGVNVVDLPEVVGMNVVIAPVNFFATMWKQGPMTMIHAAIMPTNSSTMARVFDNVELPGWKVSCMYLGRIIWKWAHIVDRMQREGLDGTLTQRAR